MADLIEKSLSTVTTLPLWRIRSAFSAACAYPSGDSAANTNTAICFFMFLPDGGGELAGLALVHELAAEIRLVEIHREQLLFRHGERIPVDDDEIRELAGFQRALDVLFPGQVRAVGRV